MDNDGDGMHILKNEVQNLIQIVQAFSYELTVLQDFMEVQFGPCYESFRESYTQAATTDGKDTTNISAVLDLKSISESLNEGRRDTGYDKHRIKRKVDGNSSNKRSFIDKDIETPYLTKVESCNSEDPLESNTPSEDEKTNFQADHVETLTSSCTAKSAGVANNIGTISKKSATNSTNSEKGRRYSSIWSKFQVSYLPDGKKLVKCPVCLKNVSSKSERLVNHYKKCGKLSEKSHEFVLSVKTVELEKLTTESILQKKKKVQKSSNDVTNLLGPLYGGRRLDPVWDYFTVVDNQETGKKSTICKRCGIKVSSKVERVRKHFIVCEELDRGMESDV